VKISSTPIHLEYDPDKKIGRLAYAIRSHWVKSWTYDIDDAAREARGILERALKSQAPAGTHYIINPDGSWYMSKPATLKKSIKVHLDLRKVWGHEYVIVAAEHAKYVVNPTKPHLIKAKKARFLRFVWPNAPPDIVRRFGGHVVYFKQVWHPGTKGNPFHLRAFESVEDQIMALYQEGGEKSIRDLAQKWL
jgi:hypothetical protein